MTLMRKFLLTLLLCTIAPRIVAQGPIQNWFNGYVDNDYGYTLNNQAPLNHCLVGNGTYYLDSPNCATANVLNPALCGGTNKPSWCSGNDIFGWTNSAITYCDTTLFGECSIIIAPGSYSDSSTLNCGNNITITANGVIISYTGINGTAIFCANVSKPVIIGMRLNGPGASTATVGLTVGSGNGLGETLAGMFQNIHVCGFGKGFVVDGGNNSGTYYNYFVKNHAGSLGPDCSGGNGIGWYVVPTVSDHANVNHFIADTAQSSLTHGWQIDGVIGDDFNGDEAEVNNQSATTGYGFYLPGTMTTEGNTFEGGYTENNTAGIYCGSSANVRENVINGTWFTDGVSATGVCSGALMQMNTPGNGSVDYYGGPYQYHVNASTGSQFAFAVVNDENPPSTVKNVFGVSRTAANNGELELGTAEYPPQLRYNLDANTYDLNNIHAIQMTGQHSYIRHTTLTASITWSATAANTCASQTATVTGLQSADFVLSVVPPSISAHVIMSQWFPSAANTVAVMICGDGTGGTAASGTYTFDVEQ